MSRRTLTIIDTTSEMREIDLDRIGKRELLLGRNAEQCEVVLADPIISKVQGKFLMKKDSVAYEDQDSSNGTFVANMGENRLLSKKDGICRAVGQECAENWKYPSAGSDGIAVVQGF